MPSYDRFCHAQSLPSMAQDKHKLHRKSMRCRECMLVLFSCCFVRHVHMYRDTCVQTSYDESAATGMGISETAEWQDLVSHVADIKELHLRDLLLDESRIDALSMESDGVYADFSRQRATVETKEVRPALDPAAGASACHGHTMSCRPAELIRPHTAYNMACRSS